MKTVPPVAIILFLIRCSDTCFNSVLLFPEEFVEEVIQYVAVVDKILMNFNRTAGLFRSILYTKLFAVFLLALSCLGTKGVKGEKFTWGKIWTVLATGFVLFFLN